MFISFIPLTIGYILLFIPNPSWDVSQTGLFLWMVSFAVLTRVGMTLFDIPHRGLGAELSKDYEERALIMSWRELFGWLAGLTNAFLGYFIFLRATPEYPRGMLNPDAYLPFAFAGAAIMIMSILFSSFSTLKVGQSLSRWSGSIKLIDIYNELKSFDVQVDVHDPWVSYEDVKHEYGIEVLSKISEDSQYSAVISIGGSVNFDHCTFGNYWNGTRNSGLFAFSDYYESGSTIQYRPFTTATFTNSIIYGNNDNEFVIDTLARSLAGSAPVFNFANCLIKTDMTIANANFFSNCITNSDPLFVDPYVWNYHIPSNSSAVGQAFGSTTGNDLDGNGRFGNTIGCYEYQ